MNLFIPFNSKTVLNSKCSNNIINANNAILSEKIKSS